MHAGRKKQLFSEVEVNSGGSKCTNNAQNEYKYHAIFALQRNG